MGASEEALQRLYRAPLAHFLAERKRLAAELAAQGDAAGAAQLARRPKPITSVWAVNQLYWHARDAFDDMFDAAARLRQGDGRAARAYHDAIATLRTRAAALLKAAGYAASDATLRRIATTLAAIAAAGGFEPDPPGALAADRDPPGFESVGIAATRITDGENSAATHHATGPPAPSGDEHAGHAHAGPDSDRAAVARERARLRAAAEMERKRRAAVRAHRTAERSRLQTALRAATAEVRRRERARAELEKQLGDADEAVGDARELVRDLERRLAALDDGT